MKPISQFLVALTIAAAPALTHAQETGGTVTATLDLDQRSWIVSGHGAPKPSQWSEAEDGLSAEINAIPDAASAGVTEPAERLTLRFMAAATGASAKAENLKITLEGLDGGETLTAAPQNTDITLNALSVEGTDMIVAGSFVAVLTEGPQTGLVAADADGAVTIDGNFQATIQQRDSGGAS